MGLDMYLTGSEYVINDSTKIDESADVLGVTESNEVALGYWRKHPDIHGAIVETFAGGVDECQPIPLTEDNIHTLIEMVKNKQLPTTQGFFFGKSSGTAEEMQEDIAILTKALDWLHEDTTVKKLIYQASW